LRFFSACFELLSGERNLEEEKVSKLKTPLCGKEFRSFFVKGEPKDKLAQNYEEKSRGRT